MEIFRKVTHKAYHSMVKRDCLYKYLREMKDFPFRDQEYIESYQEAHLKDLFKHCRASIPYYRDVFSSFSIDVEQENALSNLRKMPFLTKHKIRKNKDLIRDLSYEKRLIHEGSTSGSTGESLFFVFDHNNSLRRMAATFRYMNWCGVSPYCRQATLWGARFDEPQKSKSLIEIIRSKFRQTLFLSSYELSEKDMSNYVHQLQYFKPSYLVSYPSPLEEFSRFLLKNKSSIPSIKAIVTSAEQLFDHQRDTIERAFGTAVLNRYGCREFGNIAHEHCDRDGLYISADRVILETIREDGSLCAPGELGEIVITDLDNYAMPFIRYRTGDMGVLASEDIKKTINLPRLERLKGRTFDIVRTPSGQAIAGTFWTLAVRYCSKKVKAIQVVQVDLANITINLQMEGGVELSSEEEALLLQRIRNQAPDLKVMIKYVKFIPQTPSGKKKFVISHLPKN